MKYLPTLALGALLLASSINAQDLAFKLGPFSMQFNVQGSGYANDYQDILNSPICYAISHQKRLDMIIESKEKIGTKEVKITTKRLVVEPYALGIGQDGQPVLSGNVTHEKLIKEVTVKFGEDQWSEGSDWSNSKSEEGFFSGWFKSDKSQNIDIKKISNLYVINDSHFDAPKDYQGIKDNNIKVICQLPVRGE